jgi:hypothetical protein
MTKSRGFFSVNVCSHCRKQLTLNDDLLGSRKCSECIYFETIGVHSVEQYNDWLPEIKIVKNDKN